MQVYFCFYRKCVFVSALMWSVQVFILKIGYYWVPLTGLLNSPFSFSKIGLDFGGAETGWKTVTDWPMGVNRGWYQNMRLLLLASQWSGCFPICLLHFKDNPLQYLHRCLQQNINWKKRIQFGSSEQFVIGILKSIGKNSVGFFYRMQFGLFGVCFLNIDTRICFEFIVHATQCGVLHSNIRCIASAVKMHSLIKLQINNISLYLNGHQ